MASAAVSGDGAGGREEGLGVAGRMVQRNWCHLFAIPALRSERLVPAAECVNLKDPIIYKDSEEIVVDAGET